MSQTLNHRLATAGALLAILVLMLPACSGDDGNPAAPVDDPLANTPPIPVVDNPLDTLPASSDTLAVELAALRNFSPALAGASAALLDELNQAVVVDFRLPPSRNVLVADGRACYPENLQWNTGSGWRPLPRTQASAPFTHLGTHGGSHYYLAQAPTRWFFADVNCRNFGGHLASLTSPDENAFVTAQVQAALPGTSFFIGMTDWARPNGDWIWTCGESCDWFNWAPGEPNNGGGAEEFVCVYATGQWNDTTSGYRAPYVLERSMPLPETDAEQVPCALADGDLMHLDGLAGPSVMPHLQRRLYWELVFQTTLSSNTTYEDRQSYYVGADTTSAMSFGWSIGVSASASWGFASVEISSEFHQDFSHEVTVSSSEEHSKTYTYTAPPGKTAVVALWHLREVFVVTDGEGNDWNDPRYDMSGPLPVLDQGLTKEYLQTIEFDNR
jgi:hypothetical protein